ncbi:hypothetical protein Tco_0635051 [Tanacetum coccineum]
MLALTSELGLEVKPEARLTHLLFLFQRFEGSFRWKSKTIDFTQCTNRSELEIGFVLLMTMWLCFVFRYQQHVLVSPDFVMIVPGYTSDFGILSSPAFDIVCYASTFFSDFGLSVLDLTDVSLLQFGLHRNEILSSTEFAL